tara:strand:+ start:209 stop:400 length:192 start_codon:yes stop_codon:yes gene_type:complete
MGFLIYFWQSIAQAAIKYRYKPLFVNENIIPSIVKRNIGRQILGSEETPRGLLSAVNKPAAHR